MISISMAFFADTDLARHCLWVLDRPVGFVRRLGPCRTDAAVANAWRARGGGKPALHACLCRTSAKRISPTAPGDKNPLARVSLEAVCRCGVKKSLAS
jgi:hypothetical protein